MGLRMSTRAGRIFKFHSAAQDDETFHVVTLDGREAISRPYRFELNLTAKKEGIDLSKVLEEPAYLGFKAGVSVQGGKKRGVQSLRIHGMISEIEECEQQADWTIYRAVMVPRLWRLGQNVQSRIFMEKSVPEIVKEILTKTGFGKEDFEFRTDAREYAKREYVVQYEESDLDFISRLLEDEGIFYFFSHAGVEERVIFADASGAYEPLPGDNEFPFLPEKGGDKSALDLLGLDSISRFTKFQQTLPGEIRLNDYNYRKPGVDLGVTREVTEQGYGTQSRYGEHYKTPEEGKVIAEIRAQEILWKQNIFRGTTDIRSLRAGFIFNLSSHPREGYAGAYVVTEIRHKGEQMIPMGHGSALNATYENEFSSIPAEVIFRPDRVTPKPRIWGMVNAHIDAAGNGEYAELDDQGRYKVRFPWDTSDAAGGKATRFIRMAQPYAGGGMGMHFPLHKGTEVLLTHIDGDPDRPIIAAAVPNPQTTSPVVGENQTQCVTISGSGNAILLEDLADEERFLVVAKKDHEVWTNNDIFERCGRDRHLTVGHNQVEKVDNDLHEKIGRDRIQQVDGCRHASVMSHDVLDVAGKSSLSVEGKTIRTFGAGYSEKTKGVHSVEADSAVIKTSTGITLQCGASSIVVDAAGVTLTGPSLTLDSAAVKIASGPGSPPASPKSQEAMVPKPPIEPAEPGNLENTPKVEEGARSESTPPGGGAVGSDPSWIEIELKDKSGKPVPNELYQVKLPTGLLLRGRLDKEGRSRVEGIPGGEGEVTLPRLDKDRWQRS